MDSINKHYEGYRNEAIKQSIQNLATTRQAKKKKSSILPELNLNHRSQEDSNEQEGRG